MQGNEDKVCFVKAAMAYARSWRWKACGTESVYYSYRSVFIWDPVQKWEADWDRCVVFAILCSLV